MKYLMLLALALTLMSCQTIQNDIFETGENSKNGNGEWMPIDARWFNTGQSEFFFEDNAYAMKFKTLSDITVTIFEKATGNEFDVRLWGDDYLFIRKCDAKSQTCRLQNQGGRSNTYYEEIGHPLKDIDFCLNELEKEKLSNKKHFRVLQIKEHGKPLSTSKIVADSRVFNDINTMKFSASQLIKLIQSGYFHFSIKDKNYVFRPWEFEPY